MIKIPPRMYMVVSNPVVLDEDSRPVMDKFSQFKLRHGDVEIRTAVTHPSPFPLYPGELEQQGITQLEVVRKNAALKLGAVRDFIEPLSDINGSDTDDGMVDDDEQLFRGPGTYLPRVEVTVVDHIKSVIVKNNTALRLRALRATTDTLDRSIQRKAVEEYLVRRSGAYLPSVDEEVIGVVNANIITEKKALQLSAEKTFMDVYGKERKAGEEWLVTI